MFGSPTPYLSLYRRAISSNIEDYEVVNDTRIILSTTGITYNLVEFADEGTYLLLAETILGNSNISFTVYVGVLLV